MGERNEASMMRSVLTVLEYVFVIDDINIQNFGSRTTGLSIMQVEEALKAPS